MPTHDTAKILRLCITLSGLSPARYAQLRMAGRPGRTITAWLTGQNPVPPSVLSWLETTPEYEKAVEVLATDGLSSSPPDETESGLA